MFLDIKSITSVGGSSNTDGSGLSVSNDVPIIDTREIKTTLFVKNGGTVRLGGFLKDKTTISEEKIPILGDIPLIGLLFKKDKSKS